MQKTPIVRERSLRERINSVDCLARVRGTQKIEAKAKVPLASMS